MTVMKSKVFPFDPGSEFLTPEGCWIIEMSNDADDPDCSVARARVSPGATTEWHHLEGVAERYVILEGRGLVEVSGLAATTVQHGDVVRIPAGVAQRITNTGDGDLVFLCVCTPRFRAELYVRREDLDRRA